MYLSISVLNVPLPYAEVVAFVAPFISYSTTKGESHSCISKHRKAERKGDCRHKTRNRNHTLRWTWQRVFQCDDALRWYPIVFNHFFVIWIKFPFIYIIKTFTYIKYQPFCSSPLLVSLRLVQTRMIKNSYKTVYIQFWDFSMKVQTGGAGGNVQGFMKLTRKNIRKKKTLDVCWHLFTSLYEEHVFQ